MDTVFSVPIVITASAAVIIGCWDFRRFRIPNFLTLPLMFTGWLYHAWAEGMAGLGVAVLGTVVCGSVLFIPYLIGGIGGGDVKLLAAMGAWLNIRYVLLAFGFGGILVGCVSLYRLCHERSFHRSALLSLRLAKAQLIHLTQSLATHDGVEDIAPNEETRHRLIPFGAFFAVGLFLVIVWNVFRFELPISFR